MKLGQRHSGTWKLEEAVTAYREVERIEVLTVAGSLDVDALAVRTPGNLPILLDIAPFIMGLREAGLGW